MGDNQVIRLGDFSGGMRNRYASPLNSAPNSLTDGENITLQNRILETRPGYEVYSTGSLPVGTVRYLEQVRFPTNEQAFLIAQMQMDQRLGGVERSYHCVNYYNGKLYIWGGGSVVMDIYDIATGVWSTGTSSSVTRTMTKGVVVSDKIYYWAGWDGAQAVNTMLIYDITLDSWSTGTSGGTARNSHCAEYYNGKIYYFSGFTTTVDIYDISGDSWSTGTSGGPSDTNDMASCIVSDIVYLWAGQGEGYWNTMYKYDITGNSWTTLASGGTARAGHSMEYYNGYIYAWGGWTGAGTPLDVMDAYSVSGNSYSSGVDGGNARKFHDGAYDGSRYWYLHGGVDENDENINYLDIFDFATMTWITGSFGELYAALDDGSPSFEKIYDLGTSPGVVSCAVLNDVTVITEGVEKQPLWWAGCLDESGATDWTNPLAVWVSQDGENWFDISGEVLDKDDDQYATLQNGVSSLGALLIKCPVPYVKGFYIEFETVNTSEGGSTAVTGTFTFDETTDITQSDLKGDIVYWKQDSGLTGHFEGITKNPDAAAAVDKGGGLVGIPMTGQPYSTGDILEFRGTTNYNGTQVVDATSSANEIVITDTFAVETFTGSETINQRMTLGTGNDCPDVEEGIVIYYSGGSKIIYSITDDGEADSEVQLSGSLTDQTITNIYGLLIDADGVRPGALDEDTVDDYETVNITSQISPVYNTSGGPSSYRNVFNYGGGFSTDGNQIRFQLKSGSYGSYNGMSIRNVAIVERSGTTDDGTTTPTEVSLSAASIAALQTPGTTAYTEWIDYTFDHTKQYLGIVDINLYTSLNGNTTYGMMGISVNETGSGGSYYKGNTTSYNIQNFTADHIAAEPYSPTPRRSAISKLEVRLRSSIPTTQFVGYSDILEQPYDLLSSITIDADEPSGSTIYYAFSTDDGNTFAVYLSGAWQDIVQYDYPNWQYWDGASWQNATTNSRLGALEEAFADTDNQMDESEVEALTGDELNDTSFYVAGVSTGIIVAVAMVSGGTGSTIPVLRSVSLAGLAYGSTAVQLYVDGDWETDANWSDGTAIGDTSFAQDGIIQTSEDYAECEYHVEMGEPGYYIKLRFAQGLTIGTAITRIRMSAPCQPLANIGLGWQETVLGFLYVDDSDDAIKDYTSEVSDYTETDDSAAWLVDDISDPDTAVPMDENDSILIGDVTQFNQVQLTINKTYNNTNTATLTAYYWNGEEWYTLTITDGTSANSATLAQKGTISFTLPTDWVEHSPYGEFSRGYWIKLMVSTDLTVTGITEVRLQPVPNALRKHKYAASWRNRIVMAARPEATDQVDFTRELEEYGWTGGDIFQQRVGGQDNVVALFSAFDRCFIVKPKDWFMASSSSGSISIARLASITEAPVNNRCLVHAPAGPLGQGAAPGLFFLGLNGAYLVTGIQSDLEWGTGQIQKISDSVNWWQSDPTVRLDLDYLYLSYGMYSSKHHCIFWAVPMITDGSTPQTTPNYLLVYDIGLGCWYPPWDLAFSALCSGFESNSNAPGKLGQPVLYAGDSSGRVLKLFEATTDNTSEIDAYAVTGLLTPGTEIQWQFEGIYIVGKTASADDELDMSIFLDGETTASIDVLLSKAGDDTYSTYEAVNDFAGAYDGALARFFKYKIDMSGPSKIFGIDTKLWTDIEDPATG